MNFKRYLFSPPQRFLIPKLEKHNRTGQSDSFGESSPQYFKMIICVCVCTKSVDSDYHVEIDWNEEGVLSE